MPTGNEFKKVRPGDSLNIPAALHNLTIDMARDFKGCQLDVAGRGAPDRWSTGVFLVQNSCGSDCDRSDVLGIDGPIITPTESEERFKAQVTLNGTTPSSSSHEGRFVILLEPIANGKVGLGCASGVCVANVDMTSPGHRHAEIADGQRGYLTSGDSGSAVILYADGGTGVTLAIVRIGASAATGSSETFPAKISASLGSGAYTAKEQVADGAGALQDKSGASDITIYNLAEEGGVSSKSVCKVNTYVMVTKVGSYHWFERATNVQYRES